MTFCRELAKFSLSPNCPQHVVENWCRYKRGMSYGEFYQCMYYFTQENILVYKYILLLHMRNLFYIKHRNVIAHMLAGEICSILDKYAGKTNIHGSNGIFEFINGET